MTRNHSSIAWKDKIAVRQSVPIAAAWLLVLTLILNLAYSYARDNTVASAENHLAKMASALRLRDSMYKSRLERKVRPLAQAIESSAPPLNLPESLDETGNPLTVPIRRLVADERWPGDIMILMEKASGEFQARRYQVGGQAWTLSPSLLRGDLAMVLDRRDHWHSPAAGPDGELRLRYSLPLMLKKNGVQGVITVTMTTKWFEEAIRETSTLFQDCATFLLSVEDGAWTIGAPTRPGDTTALESLKEKMLRDKSGSQGLDLDGRSYIVLFFPAVINDVLLGVMVPRERLLGGLERLTRILAALGFLITLATAYGLHRTAIVMLRPLRLLVETAVRLSRGDFSPAAGGASLRRGDKIWGSLAAAEHLRQALQERLRETTAAAVTRERLFGELTLARGLQESLRPKNFPVEKRCRAAVRVHLGDRVSGDLYDSFPIGEDKICFLIGNVAVHGVPAAILASRVLVIMRELISSGLDPAEALGRASRAMARGHEPADQGLPLVGVFAGVLNLADGELIWGGAGQRPPIEVRQGRTVELPWSENMPLGVSDKAGYQNLRHRLAPGDILFFCSERLTAALDAHGWPFGRKRLKKILEKGRDPESMLAAVYDAFSRHAASGGSHEDVTMLAFQWLGGAEK